jgi:glycosyltransferase involved in cell wall biosynthesis
MDRIAQEVQLADRIIVGSEFAARSFSGIRSPGSVIVVPYGVDTGAFSPRSDARVPPEGPLRILFAGGLTQRKGIGYLLDAMQQLDPSRFHLTLAGPVIGTGAGLQRFRNRYRHLAGLRPIDMPHVYRDHDVLVLPSLCEGSALVVLEAMASGIPALVTPNAGADAVSDGVDGMIVPIRDVEAIHAALQRLDRDRDLLRRLGRKARERALTHDWNGFRVALRSTIEARS